MNFGKNKIDQKSNTTVTGGNTSDIDHLFGSGGYLEKIFGKSVTKDEIVVKVLFPKIEDVFYYDGNLKQVLYRKDYNLYVVPSALTDCINGPVLTRIESADDYARIVNSLYKGHSCKTLITTPWGDNYLYCSTEHPFEDTSLEKMSLDKIIEEILTLLA